MNKNNYTSLQPYNRSRSWRTRIVVWCTRPPRILEPAAVATRSGHKFNFLMFPFCDFARWANQWSLVEDTILFCSSQQLPRLHLGPLKGFLSWHGALQGPDTYLVRCLWNYRDIRTPSGGTPQARRSEVLGHRQQQLTQTLIVRLTKTHLFTPILDFENTTE